MKLQVLTLAAVGVLTSARAEAASREVQYGPAPAWVAAAPKSTSTAAQEGAPVRIIYSDNQARLGDDGDETYTAYRMKILTPAALALGNISATWNPSSDDITVHRLEIIRDGQVIDVLAASKFQTIQRENNLDYAMLDGQLTATLQTPGLQVGDELEFAATLRRKDPTLGSRSHGFMALPATGSPGAFRLRLVWPNKKMVHWKTTPDLGPLVPSDRSNQHELVIELRDPESAVTTDGAPARFNLRRLIEYSEFSSWGEISTLLWPLFDKASNLAPDSPIRAEAKKIASATSDPAARAEAALRLVEDRIRYVYIGLDGGNFRPASADDTWNRRFGDCKAKSVLLIALLRELGIESEAVLVNSKGGDGTDQRLPNPALFDHVVVRASIGTQKYWLDGTRLGDRKLAVLPPPAFRWALPLRANAANLEPVPAQAPLLPDTVEVIEVDATAGFAVPAKYKAQQIFRGDGASTLHTQLSSLTAQDADRGQKAYWRQQMNWVEPETAAWRYDEAQNVMVLSMTGTGKPAWEGDDQQGRSLDIYHAGFTPPGERRRPKEQDQTAPWLMEFPAYSCSATTIRLPAATSQWEWDYIANPVNLRLGGRDYWRVASLQGGVMRTVMSSRTYLPEISAEQAKEVNERLPTFDNKFSRVFQTKKASLSAHAAGATFAAGLEKSIDWSSAEAPCAAPNGTAGAGVDDDPKAAFDHGDFAKAFQLFRPLAEQGDAYAQAMLGYLYSTGKGTAQDHAAALGWYRKAADQGNADGELNVGVSYESGAGAPIDYAAAQDWYRKAAEQGKAKAQLYLGRMYALGHGGPVNYPAAKDWVLKAAEQGDPEAEDVIGGFYEFGRGVPLDQAAAETWYRKAADQGYADAQFWLGAIYDSGHGRPRDASLALTWFRKAADQGHAAGQYALGRLYDSGRGVPQDSKLAVVWYRRAANQGLAEAQLNLAEMYENGAGVPKDHVMSASWYRKAAEQGSKAAQFAMGLKYESGDGLKQDLVQAYLWFSLAAAPANQQALAPRMTAAQIARAKELVRDWRPHRGS